MVRYKTNPVPQQQIKSNKAKQIKGRAKTKNITLKVGYQNTKHKHGPYQNDL